MADPERNQFFSHFTKTTFIHFEDALELGKLRLFAGRYRRGEGMQNGAYAFIDVLAARPVLMDLSWGKSVKFIDFKGGTSADKTIISRVLSIKTVVSKDNVGLGSETVWIEIKNGRGKRTKTGAVEPDGDPTVSIAIPFKIEEARRMALAVLAYISSQEAAKAVISIIGQWQNEPAPQPQAPQPQAPTTGDPGMSTVFLVEQGIVKNEKDAQILLDVLGLENGSPTKNGLRIIKIFLDWRKTPGYDASNMEAVKEAAAKAILGELPPDQ